jgi:hypothetical protein
MNQFGIWFNMGLEHILDVNGFDHILFITLLTITFPANEWKKLIVLVSAFTIGHSMALATSVFYGARIPPDLIEFMIALSILLTAVFQMVRYRDNFRRKPVVIYLIIMLFGLIHGLGFSIYLHSMLGSQEMIFLPLLYFNLGLEAGQLIIVLVIFLFSLFLAILVKWPFKIFKLLTICIIALISFKLTAERLWQLFHAS